MLFNFLNSKPLYLLVVLSPLLASNAYSANSFSTFDVRVIDGDTIEVLPKNKRSERIRLLGIDAPESSQAYGQHSKQSLQQCINNKEVTIEWNQRDRYSRMIGKVLAEGVDCNLQQVENGMAWHYKYYANQQSVNDRKTYSSSEKTAQRKKLGLWADPNPINPYHYRKSNRR